MRDLLTPKQVARALDVSESSIKRWCDRGVLTAQHTAGGHRRISRAVLTEFLRGGRHQLVNPEALGLPATSGRTERVVERACDQMATALVAGDESRCQQIARDLYLADHSVAVLCDDVFAAAMRKIGTQWEEGETEIYQERRGCEILLRILHQLRLMLPPALPDAPLAIGGTATSDGYSLGTAMAELVLRSNGWNANSLGDNLPFETLAAALRDQQPKLFWLSCTHISDQDNFLTGYERHIAPFAENVTIVVGGMALTKEIRQRMKFTVHCDSMQQFENFCKRPNA